MSNNFARLQRPNASLAGLGVRGGGIRLIQWGVIGDSGRRASEAQLVCLQMQSRAFAFARLQTA